MRTRESVMNCVLFAELEFMFESRTEINNHITNSPQQQQQHLRRASSIEMPSISPTEISFNLCNSIFFLPNTRQCFVMLIQKRFDADNLILQ